MVLQYWRIRVLMVLSALVTMGAAWGASRGLGFPGGGVRHPVVLLQPSPAIGIAAVIAVLAVGLIVGTVIAGRIRAEAGLLAAAFGWLTFTWNSGTVAQALFAAPTADTYFRFAVETAMLGVFLGAGQAVLVTLRKSGKLARDETRDGIKLDNATPGQLALGFVGTAVGYVVLAYLLIATPDKQQAVLGCAVAAWVAASLAHYFIEADLPIWVFWSAVVTAAVGAYLYAGASAPGVPAIGQAGFPPARALPLDHASAGVIGSLFGYWDARRWRRPSPAIGPGSFVESGSAEVAA